jgi:hypothetical protein
MGVVSWPQSSAPEGTAAERTAESRPAAETMLQQEKAIADSSKEAAMRTHAPREFDRHAAS